jgi:uncharacterized protein (DUF885 family)
VTVREVADRLLAELAPLDPTAAEALGQVPDSLMPKLAPEHFAGRHDAMARALAAVDATTPEAADRPLWVALRERLGSDLALDDVGFTTALLAPLATPVHAVRGVFDSFPADDWDAIGRHLREVPAALRDYAETLRGAPRVVAARQVLGAAAQCEKWVDPARDDFYRRLVRDRPEFVPAAEAASEATMHFAGFLKTELLPLAPQRDAVGRELYTVTARAFLGDDVDLDETYRFGWDELARLTAEMDDVARELGHDSIDEAAAALDADPARLLTGAVELITWLQRRVDDVVDAVDGVHVDLPPAGRRPECNISPTAVGVMYYSAPGAGFSRPGRIWWALPADGVTSTWREVTTVHHEGVPGHHLQIATAVADPDLHPWQRTMAHVHGHAEGWAHYAERLADEIGLLRDPGERLGMLYGQRWRAARIVIDMGLHLGYPIPAGNGFTDATDWSPAIGAAVLRRAAGCDDITASFEVDRYLGWPGQALAFRVGARLWRQLRARAEDRPGFDLRTFHMRALRLGPMGLGPLREVLS